MTRIGLILAVAIVFFLVWWNQTYSGVIYYGVRGTPPGATPTPTPTPSPTPTPTPTPSPTPSPPPQLYIAPAGSDGAGGSNNCRTLGTPCKTFAHVIPLIGQAGYWTVTLLDGTYSIANGNGLFSANCAGGGNAVNGTSGQHVTIQAQNERQAFIQGNGSADAFYLANCSWWDILGLHVESADLSGHAGVGAAIDVYDVSHVLLRRNLAARNNRYSNIHPFMIQSSTYVVAEENEIYYFHRWGIYAQGTPTHWATLRRNYANSRYYGDLRCQKSGSGSCGTPSACYCNDSWNTPYNTMTVGTGETTPCAGRSVGYTCGYPSAFISVSDEGVGLYYANDSLVYNNIAESNGDGFTEQNIGSGNLFIGNIALNNTQAGFQANPGGTGRRPINMSWVNNVAYHNATGFYIRSQTNAQLSYDTVIGTSGLGVAFDRDSGTDSRTTGYPTAFITNSISTTNSAGTGFYAQPPSGNNGMQDWGFSYSMAWLNSTTYSPNDAHVHSPVTSPTPDTSFYHQATGQGCIINAAGTNLHDACNGTDCGATIIYQYTGEAAGTPPTPPTLSATPLWDPTSSKFTCGALVTGLNDDATGATWDKQACGNVHLRLNVGTIATGARNGCTLPY